MLYWNDLIENNRIVSTLIKLIIRISMIRNTVLKLTGNPAKSRVIISFHKIGDTVFTIPTVSSIIKSSRSKDYIFCHNHAVSIYKHVFADSIEYMGFEDEDFIFEGRIARSVLRKKLREINPETIIDLTGSPGSATSFIFNRAKEVIGFNREVFRSLYTTFNRVDNFTHVLQIYTKAVEGYVGKEYRNSDNSFSIRPGNTGPILIHPFAGWSAKEWGLKNFINLAIYLNKLRETKLISPKDALPEEIKKEIHSVNIELIETDTVNDILLQIENSFLVVGNDSGVIYLANLLNIPTFTLFGPSNPSFHYLPSGYSDYIQKTIPCSPAVKEKLCFTNGGRDGCPSNECMKRLAPEDVYNKINDLIKKLMVNVV